MPNLIVKQILSCWMLDPVALVSSCTNGQYPRPQITYFYATHAPARRFRTFAMWVVTTRVQVCTPTPHSIGLNQG